MPTTDYRFDWPPPEMAPHYKPLPEAKLAAAVIADALIQLHRRPTRSMPVAVVETLRVEKANALAWLLDPEPMTPFSLAWCCAAMSVAIRRTILPETISAVVRSGNAPNLTWFMQRGPQPRPCRERREQRSYAERKARFAVVTR